MSLKILLCDDHAVFRQGLRQVLEREDASFIEFGSADGLLEWMGEHGDADLVLLDLEMPGLDGWSAFRTLRSHHPTVPVVIVSASEDPEQMRRALDGGASGFIPKSSSVAVLRAALELVLSGGVYVPKPAMDAASAAPGRGRAGRETRLTARQIELLRCMSRGLTNKEIASALGIAESTVKTHVKALLDVLDVTNRTEAAMAMRELGLDD